jgi:hypothetical protein
MDEPHQRSDADREFGEQIHRRLCAGDFTASAELASAWLDRLVARLHMRHPEVQDESLMYDAASDALLNYAERPETYKPSKLPLLSYLTLSANGDLLNALKKRQRRARHEFSLEAVEESRGRGNTAQEESATSDRDGPSDLEIARAIRAVIPDRRDRRIVHLMLEGERRTAVYARILKIDELTPADQERIVKRHKDRLKKQLQRRLGEAYRGRSRAN